MVLFFIKQALKKFFGNLFGIVSSSGSDPAIPSQTIRSSSLAITFISRQFGVRINADFVEGSIQKGTLSNLRELTNFFHQNKVSIKPRNSSESDLVEKKYLFPCVAIMKTGQSLILIGTDTAETEDHVQQQRVLSIDPTDPSAKVERAELKAFSKNWSKKIIIVSPLGENISQDRIFEWSWFSPELLRFKGTLFLTFIMSCFVHALGIAPILFIQISLDKVLGYNATGTLYVLTGGIIIALGFLGVLSYARDFIIEHITTTIEARMAGDAFDKLLNLPAQMFQVNSTAEMEAKVNSINTLKTFLSRQILTNIFDATGILVFVPVLIGYSPILALVVISFSIIQGIVDLISKKKVQSLSSGVGSANSSRMSVLRETISGIDTVKSLSQEPNQRRQWRHHSAGYLRASVQSTKARLVGSSINAALMNYMTVAIIFTGIMLVFAGSLSAGAIISCNMLGAKVVAPVKGLITFFADLKSIASAMERLSSVWNSPPERTGTGPQKVITGNFEFNDLSVKLGDNFALQNLSGKIPGRKKIAIVGPSGAGKTTLLRVLQGLVRPTSGIVEVDGNNLASLDLNFYRHQVCLVDNHPTFFSGTIEENIRRAKPNLSSNEFNEILEVSGLTAISKSLPEGLSTHLDVTASTLSQSHKLIVAMARGLATSSNLILLDETAQSLDKYSQLHFKKNIDNITKGKTLVLVTNDLRFLTEFDHIIVMDEGRIESYGSHDKLLSESKLYQELFEGEQALSSHIHVDSNV
jgi:ABC-type bacteriocin/lantibiotic exporter with double-glycine peptidase domain